jgi:hypothetical protein
VETLSVGYFDTKLLSGLFLVVQSKPGEEATVRISIALGLANAYWISHRDSDALILPKLMLFGRAPAILDLE